MTLNIVRQHPRFIIFILFGLLCLVLLHNAIDGAYTGPPYFMQMYPPPGGPGKSGHGMDIAWRLRKSEETYQRTLKQRVELIKKYGPTKKDIVPWPKDHKFYTLWDFFTASFNCPYEVERIGILGDGGKWVCGLSRLAKKPGCTIYSFGINDESSFEAGLLESTEHCEIWGYDFSVSDFGPEIREIPSLKRRGHFHPLGLSGKDDPAGSPPMYTIQSLMRKNGHTFIDILKIDIEGWEFPALRSIFKAYRGKPLPFGQLQLEIHADRLPGVEEAQVFTEFLAWWEELEAAGLRPFWTEPNLVFVNINLGTVPALAEYSFINIRGDHEIVH